MPHVPQTPSECRIFALRLAVRRHDGASLGRCCVLAPPEARHRLLLCVEHEARLSIEGISTATGHRFLIASKREHGELNTISDDLGPTVSPNLLGRGWAH